MMTLFFTTLLFISSAFANSLNVKLDGEFVIEMKEEDLKKSNTQVVEFYNFVTKKSEPYKGVRLRELFKKVFTGPHNIVEVEFISKNGFKSYISLDQARLGDPILAFERADGEKFVRYSQKEKALVDLGPYYVVWNLKNVPLPQQPFYSSIYQVVGVNLITSSMNFGIDSKESNESIELGARTYKRYCLSCHALNGTGGDLGVSLLKFQVLKEKGANYIKQYALDPLKSNPRTKMLPLPAFKNREAMAQGLVDFLAFVEDPKHTLREAEKLPNKKRYLLLKALLEDAKAK
ncbi:MAG: cytochrome c [Bacteriovoracaceae bacterium]|nr:cytochrome c [Bacteriovoracaceae bacterium]